MSLGMSRRQIMLLKSCTLKNNEFMELKPRFKPAYNEMYEDYEQAQFNAAEKSIRC